MTEGQQANVRSWRDIAWTVLWSGVLVGLGTNILLGNNPCILEVYSHSWVLTLAALAWFWLALFLLFGNRGRSILVVCSILAFLLTPTFIRVPVGAREADTVKRLRELMQSIDSYQKAHPLEGYPSTLADSSQVAYKIAYQVFRSTPAHPADHFLIQATPLWPECGYARSFTAADDGEIHYTLEMRAANTTDPIISHPIE